MWLNQHETLMVNLNRDTWQMTVNDSQGSYLGNVVAQIIEPQEYLVRYFLLYNPSWNRRYLLPSDTVTKITQAISCNVTTGAAVQIPDYTETLERDDEEHIYAAIDQVPYWEQPRWQ